MPAVATSTIDPDRVPAAVRRAAVEADAAALAAIRSIRGPFRLVPTRLKVLRDGDLSEGEGEESESGEGGVTDHGGQQACTRVKEMGHKGTGR